MVYRASSCSSLLIQFKLYGPYFTDGFNYLKAMEPLRGDDLLFAIKSPGGFGTYLIDLGRMKD